MSRTPRTFTERAFYSENQSSDTRLFNATSKIFDKASRQQAVSSLVSKNAREFKRLTQERMTKGLHSGRTYKKRKGAGFTRAHRASRRGQRPAPDSGTLVNAIRSQPTGPYTAKVDIAEKVNPNSGTVASKYGEILQEKLGRPIMTAKDAAEAQVKLTREATQLVGTLI